MPFIVSIRSTN